MTNEAQKSFLITINKDFDLGEKSLRLYGLLQGLFVAIDSLYALAYALTKSKTFININQNQKLRELKYIRNDVVGHPSNRVFDEKILGYCIFKKEDISNDSFKYYIYVGKEIEEKVIKIEDLYENYYTESNRLLSNIYNICVNNKENTFFNDYVMRLYNTFYQTYTYKEELKKLEIEFKKVFNNNDIKVNRLAWRISLIHELEKYNNQTKDIEELKEYALAYEINKVCELSASKDINFEIKMPLPRLLKSVFKFLNKNIDSHQYIQNIHDYSHPLFKSSLEQLIFKSEQEKFIYASTYFHFLKELDNDLVYCFGILIKSYKQNKK